MAGPPDLKAVGFEAGFATTVDADDYQPVSLNGVEVESDLPVPAAGNFVMVCDF